MLARLGEQVQEFVIVQLQHVHLYFVRKLAPERKKDVIAVNYLSDELFMYSILRA